MQNWVHLLPDILLAQRDTIYVLEETHWGRRNLQACFIFRWKWLLPTSNLRMDPQLSIISSQLSALSYQLSIISSQLSALNYQLSIMEQFSKRRQTLQADWFYSEKSFRQIQWLALLWHTPKCMCFSTLLCQVIYTPIYLQQKNKSRRVLSNKARALLGTEWTRQKSDGSNRQKIT